MSRTRLFIAEFSKRTANPKLKRFDGVHRDVTWVEVEHIADQALKSQYVSDGADFTGFFYHGRRHIDSGVLGGTSQGWIHELTPGGIKSVICCGLLLAFQAADNMPHVSKKILQSFDCLPINELSMELNSALMDDENMRILAADLYVAIMNAIIAVLDWLDNTAYGKLISSC